MAHRVTAPAMQRAQRLLSQHVRPFVVTESVPMRVEAIDETFVPLKFASAIAAPRRDIPLGSSWGRAWHTTWFRLSGVVSESLAGRPLVAQVDIGFNGRYDGFQAEALAWIDGRIVHALQPDRRLIDLGVRSVGDEIEMWVEAAATPVIAGHASGYGPTPMGDPETAPSAPLYVLRQAHIGVHNPIVDDLALRLHLAIDVTLDLAENDPQRARSFLALERAGAALDVNDPVGTAAAAVAELAPIFDGSSRRPRHRVVATGHAHLDTAWLWPIRETRRKAVRTFANAVRLLDRNPDVVFAHSQAQHYAWVLEDAPELFAEVRRLVEAGRWEPVGGMWVETDLNLPSGESLIRQLVHGQRAFSEWFGRTCDGAFLPDDFGYPGSLPQIVRHGGGRWFFTQKLSWNETDTMPHHTFWWEGIDGSRLFTHFSPIDTYNATLVPSQLRFAERNYLDHAGSSRSLALFGHGDGGGGPTQQMIDRGRIASTMDGVPTVEFGTIADFFADAEREYGEDAPTWVGEMYFEKHRGTYSSQVGTKQGNRNSERLLHEVEVWSVAAGVNVAGADGWWKRVLTQQFHDIIPGSSIAWVHRDAEAEHAAIARETEDAIEALLSPRFDDSRWIANPAPVELDGVIDVDGVPERVRVPALAVLDLSVARTEPRQSVVVESDAGGVVVSNGIVRVAWNSDGAIESIVDLVANRNLVPANRRIELTLRRDTPAEYDAWDIDRADADAPVEVLIATSAPRVEFADPRRVVVTAGFAHGGSRFVMRWSVDSDSPSIAVALEADWHENERRLQVEVPIDVLAREALCGTQFGHVRRPRHSNTSWDVARFETCAHRWVHVGEPGFGLAVLADGPRGYDVRGDAIRLTLLRSPSFPDPRADRGNQRIEWAYLPTKSDVIADGSLERAAALIAHPSRVLVGTPGVRSVGVRLDMEGALISAIKRADDGTGDVIVRVWETRGARSTGMLTSDRQLTEVLDCDALERVIGASFGSGESIPITLRPFEVRTLRLRHRVDPVAH
jgi:alpha-mannosidase